MKLLTTLSATASLLVLASAMTNVATADGIQIGDAGNAAPANIPDTNGVDIHATQPDTGITVPPPGSFCSECNAWENDCKAHCGGGRVCEDFCRCERAKRKGCRYTGMSYREDGCVELADCGRM